MNRIAKLVGFAGLLASGEAVTVSQQVSRARCEICRPRCLLPGSLKLKRPNVFTFGRC